MTIPLATIARGALYGAGVGAVLGAITQNKQVFFGTMAMLAAAGAVIAAVSVVFGSGVALGATMGLVVGLVATGDRNNRLEDRIIPIAAAVLLGGLIGATGILEGLANLPVVYVVHV